MSIMMNPYHFNDATKIEFRRTFERLKFSEDKAQDFLAHWTRNILAYTGKGLKELNNLTLSLYSRSNKEVVSNFMNSNLMFSDNAKIAALCAFLIHGLKSHKFTLPEGLSSESNKQADYCLNLAKIISQATVKIIMEGVIPFDLQSRSTEIPFKAYLVILHPSNHVDLIVDDKMGNPHQMWVSSTFSLYRFIYRPFDRTVDRELSGHSYELVGGKRTAKISFKNVA